MAERGRTILLSIVELSRLLEEQEIEEKELVEHVQSIGPASGFGRE